MAIDPDRIFDVATAIKNAVANAYAADLTARALPARQYVADSPFAIANRPGCEQFTVACERVLGFEQVPSIQSFEAKAGAAHHAMRSAIFQLAICRCNAGTPPNGAATTTAAEERSARTVYGDSGRMFNALIAEEKAGGIGGCTGLVYLDWTPPPVEGNLATGTLRIALSLMRTG